MKTSEEKDFAEEKRLLKMEAEDSGGRKWLKPKPASVMPKPRRSVKTMAFNLFLQSIASSSCCCSHSNNPGSPYWYFLPLLKFSVLRILFHFLLLLPLRVYVSFLNIILVSYFDIIHIHIFNWYCMYQYTFSQVRSSIWVHSQSPWKTEFIPQILERKKIISL